MSELHWFDANCLLGRSVRTAEGQPETADDILAAMNHFGIHEALVVDAVAREANPAAGNERVLKRTQQHPRLHPAWAGLMPHSEELPPPAELVGRMRTEGIGALFLHYGFMDVRLESWAIDGLLEELEGAGVPLFLNPNHWRQPATADQTDWDAVVRICRDFPDLPVVVSESRIFTTQRTAYAALEACPNLRLDVSALWRHGMIEFVCKRWGAQRLLFGTGLPFRDPGAVMMQVACSDVPEEDLARIAGGNLRELLAWNENVASVAEQVQLPEPIDGLHRMARERADLSGQRFLDCHGHLGGAGPMHVVHDSVEGMIDEMDRHGVELCLVFGLEGILGDETYCNDLVADAVRRFPDRFIGFTLVTPNHGERMMREELQRGHQMGLRGIKLIPHYQGYRPEGPLIDVACEFADEHGLLILNHDWGSPEQMRRLCTSYPRACFITGHAMPSYGEVTREVENLYICTCPFLEWGKCERFVEIYGAERLLFGSDLTDLPIGWGLGPIFHARIPEAEKRMILGGNLRKVLSEWGYR
ncbi:MAG: amidohydrolase family protein [Armatimonadota bacterium]|nr:amidohydrolase family protein [Armatimonadota bacterium]